MKSLFIGDFLDFEDDPKYISSSFDSNPDLDKYELIFFTPDYLEFTGEHTYYNGGILLNEETSKRLMSRMNTWSEKLKYAVGQGKSVIVNMIEMMPLYVQLEPENPVKVNNYWFCRDLIDVAMIDNATDLESSEYFEWQELWGECLPTTELNFDSRNIFPLLYANNRKNVLAAMTKPSPTSGQYIFVPKLDFYRNAQVTGDLSWTPRTKKYQMSLVEKLLELIPHCDELAKRV